MKAIDLHTHSNESDGTLTPSELVDYAVSKNLRAIALTDHDTSAGIPEAIRRAKALRSTGVDIEVIPGIELSTEYQDKEIHMLGLYIDYSGEYMLSRLKQFQRGRRLRNLQLCRLLTENGMPVSYEELLKEYPTGVITRAHLANILTKKGYTRSVREAFERFLGDGCPYFVPRKKISPQRAIEIIRRAGGFPVLAHPILYKMSRARLEELVSKLKSAGLMGIEAVYSTYEPSDERLIRTLAQKYDLCITGGSDFHGANKPQIDLGSGKGHMFVPETLLEDIKSRHQSMLKENSAYGLPKLLLTDLDGTLLKDDKSISQYTHDVLKEWTRRGHYVALCSGRDITAVNRVRDELLPDLENIFTIGYNGGLVFDNSKGKVIHRCSLNIEDVKYLSECAKQSGIYMHTYDDDRIIAPEASKELRHYTIVIKTPVLISSDITAPLQNAPCKCIMIELDDISKLDAFKERMLPWACEHDISMLYSSHNYMEVIPTRSGKGSVVPILREYLGIENLITIGAGDEQNDISLLKACDIAIAMENAIDEVKNVATTIAVDTANNDGLSKTLVDIM